MVQYHIEVGADVTVGALRVDPASARQFGVMEIDANQRIVGFEEKVANPKTIPGDPNHCLGSMGIYVFAARFLFPVSFFVPGLPLLDVLDWQGLNQQLALLFDQMKKKYFAGARKPATQEQPARTGNSPFNFSANRVNSPAR